MEYRCQKCGGRLEYTKKLILTSYPIDWVLDCPRCGTEHLLLHDKVLCTEEEYEKRICKYYRGEM